MKKIQLQSRNTVPLSQFRPNLLAISDMMSEAMADEYIMSAIRDFCVKSGVIKRKLEFTLQPGVRNYPVDLPDEEVVRLTDHPDCCQDCGGFDRTRPYLRFDRVNQHSRFYWDESAFQLGLNNCDITCAEDVCLGVVVQPAESACEVDAVLFRRHKECILNGAMYYALTAPRTPWQDKGHAADYFRLFENCAGAAAVARVLQHSTGTDRLRNRRML